jgi:hypothetical protein
MRVKLTVVNTERGGEARTYVLEQDPIVIGRAGTCDLPLDDPERVVSKQHAEIRRSGDDLRVFDLGSKNQTFVNGARVGTAGLPVADGDRITLGPFQVDVVVDRALLVADDLDRTVFGAAFVNPFQETAEGVAGALGQLRRAYAELDYGHRSDALRDALRDALGPGPDAEAVAAVVRGETAPEGSGRPRGSGRRTRDGRAFGSAHDRRGPPLRARRGGRPARQHPRAVPPRVPGPHGRPRRRDGVPLRRRRRGPRRPPRPRGRGRALRAPPRPQRRRRSRPAPPPGAPRGVPSGRP